MPKLKTRKAAAKRFRVTASGKIKRKRSKLRHILTNRTPKQKRRLRRGGYIADVDVPAMKKLLPYG
ncbi:MAG: 50S ribosomal protein L35 [Deltaproteobacteria bacterium RIFCSPLOWO2_02_FULL_44_10]|nr:MAG: 50S ribosomal protein L35 [Deltaproteobacteria bacterium RIFCSPHIGHO2_02_FULL_44_16]OGQ47396.1 MAG: 50S ribosomal protein L35 [Deltaproteobacteria bacterium RIFCSPLOWO2_02_FULL_44_10]